MNADLLTGQKVIDASGAMGAACAGFLASLGAAVTRLVPPGHAPTTAADIVDDLGKTLRAVDLATPSGVETLRGLVAEADILIEGFEAEEATALGVDPDSLAAINPRLIHVSITAFGRTGPRATWRGPELICSAMGGTLAVTGYADRAPVKEALDACIFHANGSAAAGAMFAHLERSASGLGQHVDVSVQEVAASRNTNGILVWQFDRRKLDRIGPYLAYGIARVRNIWTLKDGWCFHSLMSGRIGAPANTALSAWMSEAGFDNPMSEVDWLRYDRSALPADIRLSWESAIDAFFRSRTKHEIATEGVRRGLNATVANEPSDVLADPHLAARGFFGPAPGHPDLSLPTRFVAVGPGGAA